MWFYPQCIAAVCLLIGHVSAVAQTSAQPESAITVAATSGTPEQYAEAFDLAWNVMHHKILYATLNTAFKDSIGQDGTKSAPGLTMSQMLYLLQATAEHWKDIKDYISKVPSDADANDPQYEPIRAKFREMLNVYLQDSQFMHRMARHNNPTQPLLLEGENGKQAYDSMKMFVNHASLIDPDDPSKGTIPADDLRKLVVDFISGAETEIWYNVFDFDLKVVADALVNAHKKGRVIHGGIDKGVVDERPEVQAIVKYLKKNGDDNFKTELVDSVGLNHQKIIVRDPFGPKAAVLFLSGNFTQSCIGPEGDAVDVPAKNRPAISIPNANHAVLIEGKIPAVVARQELKKTLVYGARGQAGYPVGGAYQMSGPKDPGTNTDSWAIMTFSPNGGLGDINRDILSRLLQNTRGRIEAVHFAFSSDVLLNEIQDHATREAKLRAKHGQERNDLWRSVGDTPFAMRDWSGFLHLAGYEKDAATGKYTRAEHPVMQDVLNPTEYAAWENNIRVAPSIYGDRQYKMKDGTVLHITSKVHHKVFILPDQNISVVGTSFNPSANAEQNNEQILIVKDSAITKRARGMFGFLFQSSKRTVVQEAEIRNKWPVPDSKDDRIWDERVRDSKVTERTGSEIQDERKPEPKPVRAVRAVGGMCKDVRFN